MNNNLGDDGSFLIAPNNVIVGNVHGMTNKFATEIKVVLPTRVSRDPVRKKKLTRSV
jgi:hypothetical protein